MKGRRLRLGLAAAAGLAVLAALSPVLPATAADGGAGSGNGSFGLIPMPAADGHAAPYFTMALAAGRSATASAFVSNPGRTTVKLRISRSTGATAANGGSTFNRAFQSCSGPGCWVTGVPAAVTLPAGTGQKLRFRVSVPPGTPPGQYLAGLTAESATAPRPVSLGSAGKAAGRAIIIEQVTVGVAVTVGSLHTLTTRLAIPGVSAIVLGSTVRLDIRLENTGQTFAHGTGKASCVVTGRRHTFPVVAATVLPHDQAVIAANVPGVPAGATVPCTVRLGYAHGLTVRWSGLVNVPAASTSRIVHTGQGAYSVVPDSGIPAWAIAVMVIGGLLAAVMAVLLIRTRVRRQAGHPDQQKLLLEINWIQRVVETFKGTVTL